MNYTMLHVFAPRSKSQHIAGLQGSFLSTTGDSTEFDVIKHY